VTTNSCSARTELTRKWKRDKLADLMKLHLWTRKH